MRPFNSFALRQYLAQQAPPPITEQLQQFPTIDNPLTATSGRQMQASAKRANTAAATGSALRGFLMSR